MEDKEDFLKEKETAIAKHKGRMKIINKQKEDLKPRMKETAKKLRRML